MHDDAAFAAIIPPQAPPERESRHSDSEISKKGMTSSACTPLCLICDYAILQHESTVLILQQLCVIVNHYEQANFTKIFENLFNFIIFYLFLFIFYSFFVYFFGFSVYAAISAF